MKNFGTFILFFALLATLTGHSQAKKRAAILPANTQSAPTEQRIVDQVTTLVVDGGSIEVVDRAKTAQIMMEQNLQNNLAYPVYSPQGVARFSPESAARLGKLLGVPAIVFIRVDAWYGSQRPVNNGKKHTIYGSVTLKTTAQILNVETGAIIAAPTASFEQERILSESTDAGRGTIVGPIHIPGKQGTQGVDPTAAMGRLTETAFDTVQQELAEKITAALVAAPIQRTPQRIPKVAGVQEGMTYVNSGANAGLKPGDVFQIIRMVDSGMQDPDTHQPILRKKQVCVLTISQVEDSLASGKCAGDLAQNGDQAIAARR